MITESKWIVMWSKSLIPWNTMADLELHDQFNHLNLEPISAHSNFVQPVPTNHQYNVLHEWEKYVGGSEMGAILHKSFFKSRDELLFEKLSPANYKQSIPTSFGILLEDIHWKYIELKLSCSIIIPPSKISIYAPLWYNADGISVINDELVLFEFKTPYSWKVTNSNIPDYYYDQVQVGLMLHD